MVRRRLIFWKAFQIHELDELRRRLREAEETLNAIRDGEVDALVASGPSGEKVSLWKVRSILTAFWSKA
jgi:hypothetical protein